METVYVLLPVHNRREVTRRFVECLRAQHYPRCQLVLIDDGSTDGTEEMVRESIPSAAVIRGKGNWWWAGALQKGFRWLAAQANAPDDVVLIINDDTCFDAAFVEKGVSLLRGHPRTLLGAQAFNRETGDLLDAGRHVDWRRLTFEPASSPEDLNCLSTRGLFMRVGDIEGIGGFHPRLLPHYLSDYEFTIRARRKGWRLMTDPSLRVAMDERTTGIRERSGEGLSDALRQYFSKRSAMNPLAWTAFLALACPWPWKVRHALRTWRGVTLNLAAAAKHSWRALVSR
jgi:GT2 family glycosyltransferase